MHGACYSGLMSLMSFQLILKVVGIILQEISLQHISSRITRLRCSLMIAPSILLQDAHPDIGFQMWKVLLRACNVMCRALRAVHSCIALCVHKDICILGVDLVVDLHSWQ